MQIDMTQTKIIKPDVQTIGEWLQPQREATDRFGHVYGVIQKTNRSLWHHAPFQPIRRIVQVRGAGFIDGLGGGVNFSRDLHVECLMWPYPIEVVTPLVEERL